MTWILTIVVLLFPLPFGQPAHAAERDWSLITPQEEARDNAAPHVVQPLPRTEPGTPVIEVRQPSISRHIRNPTTIEVRFRAAPGATIEMSTFRAKYGWLGIDITARLLEHATETADSLSAKNVDLPSGDHSITVSISDSAGRTGSRVLQLLVVK
jgi:tRNA G46 methylase TrmB